KRFPSVDSPAGEIKCVALSPDGQILAVGSREEHKLHLRLWNVPTGKNISSHRYRGAYLSAAFSHDGTTLAVGKGFGGSSNRVGCVELWDVSTMQHRASLRGDMSDVTFVGFDRNGSTLVCQDYDGNIKLWEAEPVPR